ncbi:hypothetical protein GTP46_16535 [Duganella sp. FT135W]|uniref:Uncharacterized protein n=2 Tax=Duganella flavida TaxID=2692175 RepID=A0A6L8KA66_9BURK|nr:hypothetical protein [Duganella flavida]
MPVAEVWFARRDAVVTMTLKMDGAIVLESTSQESIAREMRQRGARHLSIENMYSVTLPATEAALIAADDYAFSESMAALKLIAACAVSEPVPVFAFPERRRRKALADKQGPDGA